MPRQQNGLVHWRTMIHQFSSVAEAEETPPVDESEAQRARPQSGRSPVALQGEGHCLEVLLSGLTLQGDVLHEDESHGLEPQSCGHLDCPRGSP